MTGIFWPPVTRCWLAAPAQSPAYRIPSRSHRHRTYDSTTELREFLIWSEQIELLGRRSTHNSDKSPKDLGCGTVHEAAFVAAGDYQESHMLLTEPASILLK